MGAWHMYYNLEQPFVSRLVKKKSVPPYACTCTRHESVLLLRFALRMIDKNIASSLGRVEQSRADNLGLLKTFLSSFLLFVLLFFPLSRCCCSPFHFSVCRVAQPYPRPVKSKTNRWNFHCGWPALSLVREWWSWTCRSTTQTGIFGRQHSIVWT